MFSIPSGFHRNKRIVFYPDGSSLNNFEIYRNGKVIKNSGIRNFVKLNVRKNDTIKLTSTNDSKDTSGDKSDEYKVQFEYTFNMLSKNYKEIYISPLSTLYFNLNANKQAELLGELSNITLSDLYTSRPSASLKGNIKIAHNRLAFIYKFESLLLNVINTENINTNLNNLILEDPTSLIESLNISDVIVKNNIKEIIQFYEEENHSDISPLVFINQLTRTELESDNPITINIPEQTDIDVPDPDIGGYDG